jgi:hypothetical protein
MAFLNGYTNRIRLTIDKTKVSATLTDFPVRVSLTSTNLNFADANADGFDFRFTSDDGYTLLKYERELHDSANSLAEYWVKIPSVSHTADTVFFLYYRSLDTADGADPENVWDSSFAMIHHMKDATSSTVLDSTVNNNDGTKREANNPTETTGKIAKGQAFVTASTSYITMADSVVSAATGYTQEAMVYLSTTTGTHSVFSMDLDYTIFALYPETAKIYFYLKDSGNTLHNMNADTCPTNSWTHIVQTYDGAKMRIYVNGQVYTGADDAFTVHTANDASAIGYRKSNSTQYLGGTIDEVRISKAYRAPEWVLATYYSNFDTLLTKTTESLVTMKIAIGGVWKDVDSVVAKMT